MRDVGVSGRMAPYGYASERSTSTRLGHCEKAVYACRGVLECLRYLLLACLKLYLNIFKSEPFLLLLGK
jgi:hypothetical protein